MNKELKEWTIAYIKNKDMAFRKLVKIEEDTKNDILNVHYKDKQNKHYITEKIEERIFPIIQNQEFKTIVCLNVDENFKFLIKHWNKFSTIKNLSILFVNLKTQEKWLINPQVHAMIADPASIETGLRTMYDTANGKITEIKGPKKKASMFEENSNSQEDEDVEEEN